MSVFPGANRVLDDYGLTLTRFLAFGDSRLTLKPVVGAVVMPFEPVVDLPAHLTFAVECV